MCAYAAERFNINITYVFDEEGYIQNEGESMHALIEKHQI